MGAADDAFRAKLAGLPSTGDAAGTQAFRDALASSVPVAPPMAEDSFAARLRGTASRTLQNPLMAGALGMATRVPQTAIQYAGGQLADAPAGTSSPFANDSGGSAAPATAPSFSRPTALAPGMANGWTNVDAAPELALTKPTIGRSLGSGGGVAPGQPGYFDDMRKGIGILGEKADRTARLGVAEADTAEGRADLDEQHALHLQGIADQEQAENARAAQDQKAFLAKTQQMADEIGSLKVDPSRLWHEKGAGDKIGFGIAAALSGLASGLTGKPDQFISQWSQAIDRDIDAQKTAIENKKASLSARNSVFAQMLQQTGDSRTAAAATKSLMLQGLKGQIQAQSDRLGVPIIAAKADLLTNGVQSEVNNAQTGVDKAVYDWGAQRAAAAASAAAQARKYADERMDKLTEQAFKRDELMLKAQDLAGKGKDDLTKRTTALGKELSSADLAKGRAPLDALSAEIAKTPDGQQIAGRTLADRIVASVPLIGDKLEGWKTGDQGNINKQNLEQALFAYRNQLTGSGSSDKEAEAIIKAALGSGSPAEIKNFVNNARASMTSREQAIRNGDPEAAAAYDEARVRSATALPGTVRRK